MKINGQKDSQIDGQIDSQIDGQKDSLLEHRAARAQVHELAEAHVGDLDNWFVVVQRTEQHVLGLQVTVANILDRQYRYMQVLDWIAEAVHNSTTLQYTTVY